MNNQQDPGKPTLQDVMDSDDHWVDMTGDYGWMICNAAKDLLSDLPGTFNHDSVGDLRFAYHRLESFIERLEKIAEPYAEDLAAEWAEAGHIDAQIHEGKE